MEKASEMRAERLLELRQARATLDSGADSAAVRGALEGLIAGLTPAALPFLASKELRAIFAEAPPLPAFLALHTALRSPAVAPSAKAALIPIAASVARRRLTPLLTTVLILESDDEMFQRSSVRQEIIQTLVSLPDVIATAAAGSVDFDIASYRKSMSVGICESVDEGRRRLETGSDVRMSLHSELLQRLSSGSGGGPVLGIVVPWLHWRCSSGPSGVLYSRLSQRLLLAHTRPAASAFLRLLLLKAPSLFPLLRDAGLRCRPLKGLLSGGLFTSFAFPRESRLESKVAAYWADLGAEAAPELGATVLRLTEAWADGSGLRHSGEEERRWLCRALLALAAALAPSQVQAQGEAIMGALLRGLGNHLGASNHRVRTQGMWVAQKLAAIFQPQAEQKLEFELDLTDPEIELITPLQIEEPPFGQMSLESLFVENEGKEQRLSPVMTAEVDSDDDFEPYDLPEEELRPSPKDTDDMGKEHAPPVYLRDCLEALTEDKDYRKFEVTLNTLESLIRKRSIGLTELADEIRRRCLSLEDRFSMQQFDAKVEGCLVALCVMRPREVAIGLSEDFFRRNLSHRDRLLALSALAKGAKELSSAEEGPAKALKPSTDSDHLGQMSARLGRTVRRSSAVPRGPSRPNRFSGVAEWFFFPLLHQYRGRRLEGLALGGRDSLLLSRLLFAWGAVLAAAAATPTAARMAAAILAESWALRFHPDSAVREGCLFCLSLVAALEDEETRATLELQVPWLMETADPVRGDPEPAVRRLAASALALLAQNRANAPTQIQSPTEIRMPSSACSISPSLK